MPLDNRKAALAGTASGDTSKMLGGSDLTGNKSSRAQEEPNRNILVAVARSRADSTLADALLPAVEQRASS